MSRKYTNKLLEMIEDGLVTDSTIVGCCLSYMSEADVQDMMERNELVEEEGEE